jgi:hypothetical protein
MPVLQAFCNLEFASFPAKRCLARIEKIPEAKRVSTLLAAMMLTNRLRVDELVQTIHFDEQGQYTYFAFDVRNDCHPCRGHGEVLRLDLTGYREVRCPECLGSGRMPRDEWRIDSEITASNQDGALVEISDAMKMRVQMKFCPTNSPQPGPGSLLEIESAIELTDAFLSWSKAQARAEAEKSPELAQPA